MRAPDELPAFSPRRPTGRGFLLAGAALGAAWMLARRRRGARSEAREQAARRLSGGAATIALGVLADSAMEHYRAGFYNPAMYVAPAVAALTTYAGAAAARRAPRPRPSSRAIFAAATLTGLGGLGFHTFNVARRPGGVSWQNLFYGAPIAAPVGLSVAGLFGLASRWLRSYGGDRRGPALLGLRAGKLIAHGAALGLVGTALEAGLLHFRGAFQHPAMYVPVTVPPLAAFALSALALRPSRVLRRVARGLLHATATAGIVGMGFHAYGVQRSMGGWRNWSQNVLAGPPLPAPPSFTGMALAGLAGLTLLEEATK